MAGIWQGQKALLAVLGSLLSIALGFALVAVFLALSHHDPITVYSNMLSSAFGDSFSISETLVAATPIMMTALGVSVAWRVGLLNIGVEGQLLIGAMGATFVALALPQSTPAWIMLSLMCVAACICGALWGAIPALLKVKLNVSEVIVSLLLNYVAVLVVDFLIHGPWQDPTTTSWPQTLAFPPSAELPHLDSSRVHLGLAIAVSLAVILALFSRFSCAGFKAKVMGENPLAAAYAHYKVNRYLIVAMLLSGAVAALAGFSQVSAIEGRLRSGLSPGYGYTGFLVCFLARGNFLAIILGSILLGGFLSGADSLQLSEKLPFATVNILQGAIFLFLLASEQSVKKLAGKLETRLARKAMQSAPQVVPVEVEAAIK